MGNSHRFHGAPFAMASAARRVETKVWLAQESQKLETFLPLTTISRSATEPKARTFPTSYDEDRRRVLGDQDSHELSLSAGRESFEETELFRADRGGGAKAVLRPGWTS